ncbi:STAS domain-containing protein [Streptomyces sp. NPDC002779]|uniref:STAS domain-containing protein n=1 Tax=Streptomyces sp. NPDC002779 TaxID=3364664 RepID=UPI0036B1742D
MPLSQLTVHHHGHREQALITLYGEIDLDSAPSVRKCLERCLRDGIRTIAVDLSPVTFCDCSGLNVFLHAAQRTAVAGGTLRLHHPPATLVRIVDLVGCGLLLLGPQSGRLPPPLGGTPPAPRLEGLVTNPAGGGPSGL